MNWNFQEILTKDPSSAWGCDTSGNIPPCGMAVRRTCRCTEFHLLKTQICVTRPQCVKVVSPIQSQGPINPKAWNEFANNNNIRTAFTLTSVRHSQFLVRAYSNCTSDVTDEESQFESCLGQNFVFSSQSKVTVLSTLTPVKWIWGRGRHSEAWSWPLNFHQASGLVIYGAFLPFLHTSSFLSYIEAQRQLQF